MFNVHGTQNGRTSEPFNFHLIVSDNFQRKEQTENFHAQRNELRIREINSDGCTLLYRIYFENECPITAPWYVIIVTYLQIIELFMQHINPTKIESSMLPTNYTNEWLNIGGGKIISDSKWKSEKLSVWCLFVTRT